MTVSAASGPELATKQKCDGGRPSSVEQREVPLVALHDRDDHAVGQIEEPLGERAAQHARPLREVHDLAHDAPPDRPSRDARRARARSPRGGVRIGHHEARRAAPLVGVGLGQLDRAAEEAVAARRARRADARRARRRSRRSPCRQTSQRIGRAKRSCSLPQRMFFGNARPSTRPCTTSGSTSEAGRASASTSANTNPSRRTSAPAAMWCRRAKPAPAAVGSPSGPKATDSGGPRCTRRSAACADGHAFGDDRDPARRDERPDRARGEPALEEQPLDERRGLRERGLARVRRQLLAPDLDEERAHASTGGSTMARCACATRRARFRTRPM